MTIQKPLEVRCLRCDNVWLTAMQSVCDACGCGSWQSVGDADGDALLAEEIGAKRREHLQEQRSAGGAA